MSAEPTRSAPFDRVVVPERGAYALEDFLALPLTDRVSLILTRNLSFYRGASEVSRSDALRWLRETR